MCVSVCPYWVCLCVHCYVYAPDDTHTLARNQPVDPENRQKSHHQPAGRARNYLLFTIVPSVAVFFFGSFLCIVFGPFLNLSSGFSVPRISFVLAR